MNTREWQRVVDEKIPSINEATMNYMGEYPTHEIQGFRSGEVVVVDADTLKRFLSRKNDLSVEASYVAYSLQDGFCFVTELLNQQREQTSSVKKKSSGYLEVPDDVYSYEVLRWLSDLSIVKSTREVELDIEQSSIYERFEPLRGLQPGMDFMAKGFRLFSGMSDENSGSSSETLDELIRLQISVKMLSSQLVQEGLFSERRKADLGTIMCYTSQEAKENPEDSKSFFMKLEDKYETFVEDYLTGRIPEKIQESIRRNNGVVSKKLGRGLERAQMNGQIRYFPDFLSAVYD